MLERIVHKQITSFLSQHNLLDPRQSGFRAGYSTQTALLRVSDDIRKAIDERKITILILFDFSKAFDTISHLRLLCKLKALGFTQPVLSWFASYLTGRTQAVLGEDNVPSSWLPVSSGVPQGSVLGPLLFSLFINDIRHSLSYSSHMIFADDTQIYLSCSPQFLNQGLEKIALDAAAIFEYANENDLKLNLSKSKVMVLGSEAHVRTIDINSLPPIIVNGQALPFATEARNLGVIFKSNLTWNGHVAMVSQKVNFSLHRLKYHRNSLSQPLRIKLVCTLIFPLIDYCCLVFHDLTNELDHKLQMLINSTIRFIFDLRRDVHITPYRHRLGWLSVRNRRLLFMGIFAHRIRYRGSVPYLNELFSLRNPSVRASQRIETPEHFHVPNHRTVCYRNSFHLSAIYFWHSLPSELTSETSSNIFKQKLFDHLMILEQAA